jgi:hypothetical protein
MDLMSEVQTKARFYYMDPQTQEYIAAAGVCKGIGRTTLIGGDEWQAQQLKNFVVQCPAGAYVTKVAAQSGYWSPSYQATCSDGTNLPPMGYWRNGVEPSTSAQSGDGFDELAGFTYYNNLDALRISYGGTLVAQVGSSWAPWIVFTLTTQCSEGEVVIGFHGWTALDAAGIVRMRKVGLICQAKNAV